MWVNRKRKAAARAGRGQDRSGAGRRARSAGRLRDRVARQHLVVEFLGDGLEDPRGSYLSAAHGRCCCCGRRWDGCRARMLGYGSSHSGSCRGRPFWAQLTACDVVFVSWTGLLVVCRDRMRCESLGNFGGPGESYCRQAGRPCSGHVAVHVCLLDTRDAHHSRDIASGHGE